MPEISPLGVSFWAYLFLCQQGNVTPLTPAHIYRNYRISTRFLIRIIFFHFAPKKNIYQIFWKKEIHSFQISQKRSCPREFFWKDHLFRTFEENIIFPGTFLRNIIFLKNKIIFSGKRNIIFLDNTGKIIFQYDFFGKTIFSKHLEKENTVFRAM